MFRIHFTCPWRWIPKIKWYYYGKYWLLNIVIGVMQIEIMSYWSAKVQTRMFNSITSEQWAEMFENVENNPKNLKVNKL